MLSQVSYGLFKKFNTWVQIKHQIYENYLDLLLHLVILHIRFALKSPIILYNFLGCEGHNKYRCDTLQKFRLYLSFFPQNGMRNVI